MSDFKNINLPIEEKYISYLMRNLSESDILDNHFFLNNITKDIVLSLQDLYSNNLIFSIDELHGFVRKKNSEITKEYLNDLYKKYNEFSNINFIRKEITDGYIKNKTNIVILEDLLSQTNKAGELNLDSLNSLADDLKNNISEVTNSSMLLSTTDLRDKYKKVLEERDKGLRKRTLGYNIINVKTPRVAEGGEMTLLFAQKGIGKSAFGQNIETSLISKQVPVLKFGTEMTIDTEMDRNIAMRLNMPVEELYKKNRDSKINARIDRTLEQFGSINNYYHVDESNLSFNDVDALIYKARNEFEKKGVFKNGDKYLMVTVDLASMIKEISGGYGDIIEKGANTFHNIAKKNGVHLLLTVQANENKIRQGMIKVKDPYDLDRYTLTQEDIKGGAGWAERCRMVLALTRPLMMKRQFFPEQSDEWDLEEDIIYLQCIKNNMGPLFRIPFVFVPETFRIYPKANNRK